MLFSPRPGLTRRQRGFSLIEVLLCVVLLAILIPGLLAGFGMAYASVQEARMLELAKAFAQLKMEELLGTPPLMLESKSTGATSLSSLYPELFPDGSTNYSMAVIVDADTIKVIIGFDYMGRSRQYQMVTHRAGL